ncbi:hypothetical protein DY000_02008902, partial [Brassica cretica]
VIKLYFQSAIYLPWKERNARVFTAVSSPSSVILASLDRMMRDLLLSYPGKFFFLFFSTSFYLSCIRLP